MKKKLPYRLIVFIAILFFILPGSLNGQIKRESTLNLRYNVAFPWGSFRDFISTTSGRSVHGSILYGITDNWAAGITAGFTSFYEKKTRRVYQNDDGSDISAVVSNSVETFPFMLKGKYNFRPGNKIQPFAAIGAGINLISLEQFAGEFTNISQTDIGFAANPEIGVFIPLNKWNEFGIHVAVSYYFLPYNDFGIDNFNYGTAGIGINIPLRR